MPIPLFFTLRLLLLSIFHTVHYNMKYNVKPEFAIDIRFQNSLYNNYCITIYKKISFYLKMSSLFQLLAFCCNYL